ncbi:15793_t:CDS:2, partial [Funneliformis geosporum]
KNKEGNMLKILSLDPSGTGTTGICLINGSKITFKEFKNMTGLLKLLGALECLPLDQIESLPVHQVKELSQQLFKGTKKLAEIEFKPGR